MKKKYRKNKQLLIIKSKLNKILNHAKLNFHKVWYNKTNNKELTLWN